MLSNRRDVSLVIAALNEEVLIRSTVEATLESCKQKLSSYELILIDDNSSDKTGEVMDNLAREYPHVTVVHNTKTQGLGSALKRGLELAKYEHIMLLCGDGGLPGESLPVIFDKIGQADLIIPYMGNLKRIKSGGRFYLSRTYTTLLNIIFRQDLHYYNGLPIYRTSDLRQITYISKGFAFQAEIITKLLKSGKTYLQVETLGAEKSNRSVAVSPKNFYEVGKILLKLIWEIAFFKPARPIKGGI